MNNFERINELTKEVEMFLKSQSEKRNGLYLVPKDLFLETLFDENIIISEEDGQTVGVEMNFLNKRINTKFVQTYNRLKGLVTRNEFYQICASEIMEYVTNLEAQEVRVGARGKDDIGYMVLLIDKKCFRETLEAHGINYDTNSKEFDYCVHNALTLDKLVEDSEGGCTIFGETIAEEDVIGNNSISEEEWEYFYELMDEMNLTKRQKEVIEVYIKNDYNQRATARELGVSHVAINKVLEAAKKRADKYYTVQPKKSKVEELEFILAQVVNEDKLFSFLLMNFDGSQELEDLIYRVGKDKRKKFFGAYNGKQISQRDKKLFLTEFLYYYYKFY